MHAAGKAQHLFGLPFGLHINVEPAAALEGHFDGLDDAHFFNALQTKAVGDHVNQFVRAGRRGDLALGMHPREAAGRQPLRHFFSAGVGRQLDREGQHHAGLAQGCARHQGGKDRLRCVVPHGLRGLLVKQLRGAGVEQLEVVVELGHGAHGGA